MRVMEMDVSEKMVGMNQKNTETERARRDAEKMSVGVKESWVKRRSQFIMRDTLISNAAHTRETCSSNVRY